MAGERHGLYPAKFGSLVIDQIRGVSVSPGLQLLVARPGGSLDPALIGSAFADPFMSLTTTDLKTVIDACGLTVPLIVTDPSLFQFQKRSDGGTFAGAGNHVTLTSTGGVLYVERISAAQDTTVGVEIAARFVPHWDGTTLPVEVNVAQNLAGTPAHNQTYYMGPVSAMGALLDGVVGWSFDPGIAYQTYRHNGEAFARTGHVYARAPRFELTVLRTSYLNTTDLFGLALSSGGIVCFAQKAVHGSTRVAKANAVHVSVTIATGTIHPNQISVQDVGDTTVTLAVNGIETVSVNTAVAIGV